MLILANVHTAIEQLWSNKMRSVLTVLGIVIAVRYHAEMASKYRTAASQPWLAVEADAPTPEFPEL